MLVERMPRRDYRSIEVILQNTLKFVDRDQITKEKVKELGLKIGKNLGIEKFKASRTWCNRFLSDFFSRFGGDEYNIRGFVI